MATALRNNMEVINIPIDRINPNPYQPRRFFDSSSLTELAKSIKIHGVISPISVRLIGSYSYELITGERRLRASRLAGLKTIPSIVININDQESAIIAVIENLQRQNLNYFEEAEGYKNLMYDYSFTQEDIALKLGKSQSAIANKVRLLRLTKPVQRLLMEHDLSERHARALLKVEREKMQLDILQKVIENGLSVKKTEKLIEQMLKDTEPASNPKLQRIKRHLKDIRLFTNSIKQTVCIMNESGIKTDYSVSNGEDYFEIKIKVAY